jgi:RNA polymerase sigma-70 factor (ECF subfamily)
MGMKPAQVHATADDAPDVEIVSAVVAGDIARFAVLVRRHNQALYRACRAVLGDDTEAEDAVQAAWVAAYRHLATFRGDAAFKTWVTRIAVHEASARRKKRARLAAVSVEEITVPDSSSPERDAFRDQLARLLERELDALPEGMRSVLVLRDVLELDTAETAAALEISDEAVRVRLHRARAALARQVATLVEHGAPQLWRFDGERCARIVDRVMAEISAA